MVHPTSPISSPSSNSFYLPPPALDIEQGVLPPSALGLERAQDAEKPVENVPGSGGAWEFFLGDSLLGSLFREHDEPAVFNADWFIFEFASRLSGNPPEEKETLAIIETLSSLFPTDRDALIDLMRLLEGVCYSRKTLGLKDQMVAEKRALFHYLVELSSDDREVFVAPLRFMIEKERFASLWEPGEILKLLKQCAAIPFDLREGCIDHFKSIISVHPGLFYDPWEVTELLTLLHSTLPLPRGISVAYLQCLMETGQIYSGPREVMKLFKFFALLPLDSWEVRLDLFKGCMRQMRSTILEHPKCSLNWDADEVLTLTEQIGAIRADLREEYLADLKFILDIDRIESWHSSQIFDLAKRFALMQPDSRRICGDCLKWGMDQNQFKHVKVKQAEEYLDKICAMEQRIPDRFALETRKLLLRLFPLYWPIEKLSAIEHILDPYDYPPEQLNALLQDAVIVCGKTGDVDDIKAALETVSKTSPEDRKVCVPYLQQLDRSSWFAEQRIELFRYLVTLPGPDLQSCIPLLLSVTTKHPFCDFWKWDQEMALFRAIVSIEASREECVRHLEAIIDASHIFWKDDQVVALLQTIHRTEKGMFRHPSITNPERYQGAHPRLLVMAIDLGRKKWTPEQINNFLVMTSHISEHMIDNDVKPLVRQLWEGCIWRKKTIHEFFKIIYSLSNGPLVRRIPSALNYFNGLVYAWNEKGDSRWIEDIATVWSDGIGKTQVLFTEAGETEILKSIEMILTQPRTFRWS